MARHIMLNGEILPSDKPCLGYNNRGTIWGDSFTIQLRGNSCFVYDFDNYFAVITKMLETYSMKPKDWFSAKNMANDICLLLRKNRIYKEFYVTITFFRNSDNNEKLASDNTFSLLMSAESLPHEFYSINKDGIFTDVMDNYAQESLPTSNFQPELLCHKIMLEKELDDIIITDNMSNYRRSLFSDIFFINDNSLVYASYPNSISINTVFSSRIMEIADKKLNMKIYHSPVNHNTLKNIKGMFLADPLNGIRWVVGLGLDRFYQENINDIALEVYFYYKSEIENKKALQ